MYIGADAKKRAKVEAVNRIAATLERHINEQILRQVDPVQIYTYHQISAATGVPESTVRDLCFGIDGGSNGFTVTKPGLTS